MNYIAIFVLFAGISIATGFFLLMGQRDARTRKKIIWLTIGLPAILAGLLMLVIFAGMMMIGD